VQSGAFGFTQSESAWAPVNLAHLLQAAPRLASGFCPSICSFWQELVLRTLLNKDGEAAAAQAKRQAKAITRIVSGLQLLQGGAQWVG